MADEWKPISQAAKIDQEPLLMFGYSAGCVDCQFVGWWDDFVMHWSSLGGPCVRFHDHTIQIPFNSAKHQVPALGSKYVA